MDALPERGSEEPAGNVPAGYLTPNGTCTRCNAPVAWVKTVRGKNLPLDPRPSSSPDAGNFGLTADGLALYVAEPKRRTAFGEDGTSEFPIYIGHFASCSGQS